MARTPAGFSAVFPGIYGTGCAIFKDIATNGK
jgi:hypothetical protein